MKVYPACAGIHRSVEVRSRYLSGLPRMRGDPPGFGNTQNKISVSTPHARGSTPGAVWLWM